MNLELAPESPPISPPHSGWKVLIVDDEPEVHSVTRLALKGFEFSTRPLQLITAHSGDEARRIAREQPDIALILLDVVMETDDAGLRVVRYIREELDNAFVRIILRTGQPGQAPEHEVITTYDINDYKNKTELTQEKLFTTVYTSLSAYRHLVALDHNRRGLEKVIEASAEIFDLRKLHDFMDGVLQQLTALLFLDDDALILHASGFAAENGDRALHIVAASGRFHEYLGQPITQCTQPEVNELLQRAIATGKSQLENDRFLGYHVSADGHSHVVYVSGNSALSISDRHLLELFLRNVAIAHANARLYAKATQ